MTLTIILTIITNHTGLVSTLIYEVSANILLITPANEYCKQQLSSINNITYNLHNEINNLLDDINLIKLIYLSDKNSWNLLLGLQVSIFNSILSFNNWIKDYKQQLPISFYSEFFNIDDENEFNSLFTTLKINDILTKYELEMCKFDLDTYLSNYSNSYYFDTINKKLYLVTSNLSNINIDLNTKLITKKNEETYLEDVLAIETAFTEFKDNLKNMNSGWDIVKNSINFRIEDFNLRKQAFLVALPNLNQIVFQIFNHFDFNDFPSFNFAPNTLIITNKMSIVSAYTDEATGNKLVWTGGLTNNIQYTQVEYKNKIISVPSGTIDVSLLLPTTSLNRLIGYNIYTQSTNVGSWHWTHFDEQSNTAVTLCLTKDQAPSCFQ